MIHQRNAVMKLMLRCLGVLAMLLMTTVGEAQALQLVRAIPKSSLTDAAGKPLLLQWTPEDDGAGDFGFIWAGQAVYFGRGGWVYDLDTNQIRCELPADLYRVVLSKDGNLAFGWLQGEVLWRMEGRKQEKGPLRAMTGPVASWFLIHPSNAMVVSWDMDLRGPNEMDALDFFDAKSGRLIHQERAKDSITSLEYMTSDGRYLLVHCHNERKLLDLRTLKYSEIGVPGGESRSFVFNRDATWVAGFSEDFDNDGKQVALFLWDRISKKFIWKGKLFGAPVSFSANDAYLLVRGGSIIRTNTGETAFQDLKGKFGKFSPDGRSVVTVDEEAFYIYTLPKESEPIFGVFQKPEPWSPPKAKAAAKPKGKTKKP